MKSEQLETRENDPLYEQAKRIVAQSGVPSISRIQRHLRIGYNHAARLLEAMEGEVVTPADKFGVRTVINADCASNNPPITDETKRIAALKAEANAKLLEAEKAWHAFACELPIGSERERAFEVYENVRTAPRIGV